MGRKFIIGLSFGVALFFAGSVLAFENHSGWWFIKGKSGTGLSVEIQGEVLFAALYTYDNQGNPIWLSGTACKDEGNSYSGDLQVWRGWPFNGAFSPPSSRSIGRLNIVFDSSNSDLASLAYSIDDGSVSFFTQPVSVQITKFLQTISPGSLDPRDINGWWYDPSFNGMGWFVEARGGVLFLAWYHYNESGDMPEWHSCYGQFPEDASSFTCTLQQWRGGSPLGDTSYHAPNHIDEGETRLVFSQAGTAQFLWNGHTYTLQRFYFGSSSGADLPSICSETSASNSTGCVDLSGQWFVSENYTLHCSASDGEKLSMPVNPKGVITIEQEGCSISFVPVWADKSSFFSDVSLEGAKKSGYVEGNRVTLTGKIGIDLTGQYGVTTSWRKNYAEITGELRENQIFLSSPSNGLEGRVCIDGDCEDIRCTLDNYYTILTRY